MKRHCLPASFVCLTVLLFGSLLCSAQERVLVVGDEELRFTPAPERGYVVKLTEGGNLKSLDGMPGFDVARARAIRGLDRHGLWTVENAGPDAKNRQIMATLKQKAPVSYVAPLFSANGETVVIIPEIVIHVQPGIKIEDVKSLCQPVGCTIKKRMEFTTQEYLLGVLGSDAQAVFTAVEELNGHPEVEWACPNTAIRPRLCGQVIPNDEYFPIQWHLQNTGQSGGTPGADIRAPEAWEITTGAPDIVVAVLDTGVDINHPDLAGSIIAGYDFFDGDDLAEPGTTDINDVHGTSCAGVVAAQGNNTIGVTGVSWNCKLMPIRIFSTDDFATDADIATGFRWAADHGADILSNSWGFRNVSTAITYSAIQDITRPGGIGREGKGCLVFAAAGNAAATYHIRPAIYPEVIAVGATDHNDVKCTYSTFGPELDLTAPSAWQWEDHDWISSSCRGSIWTTDISGVGGYSVLNADYGIDAEMLDYTAMGGTSMACPIAAGVAALVLSVDPNLTNDQVRHILYRSAHDLGDPGWDEYYGWGRVDARAAVELALDGMPPLYVDDDATNDPGPGDSSVSDPNENGSTEHPFDSVQEAIDYAFPGDTIILRDGIYSGPGNVDISFGGKAITVRSQNGPKRCIVDCLGQGRGFIFSTGEDPNAILEGITITGAAASKGAGIRINGGSPTVRNCAVIGNTASMDGGGIAISGESNPVIANCLIAKNSALLAGGMNIETANIAIDNCTVVGNTALLAAGGIAARNMAVELTNCILWNNVPAQIYGDAIVTFSDIEGLWEGQGNIDTDPLFADSANGDYHLSSQTGRWDPAGETWVQDAVTSPCIDAGDPGSPFGDETEPNGGRINMGAYGGTAQASKSQ